MRQFAIIGLGRFGSKVARTLASMKVPVIAIDKDPRRVDDLRDVVDFALEADATDPKALAQAGVSESDVAVISLGNYLEASVLATILLKEIGIQEIIVKGTSPEHGKILSLVGATQVVFPEEDIATRLAQRIISPNVLDLIPLFPGYSIVELMAPTDFVGKTLLDLNIRRNYGLEVLIIKKGESAKVIPSALDSIEYGDALVVLGKDEDIEKLKSLS